MPERSVTPVLKRGDRIEHPVLGHGVVVLDQTAPRVKVRWDDTGQIGSVRATVLKVADNNAA